MAGAELPTWPANLDRHSQRERDAQRASATPRHTPPQQAGPHKESRPGFPHASTPSPTDERLRDTIAKRMRMSHYERGTYNLVGGVAAGFCAAVELSDAVTWPKASVAEPLRDPLLELWRQRVRVTGFSES